MKPVLQFHPVTWPLLAWSTAVVAGFLIPALGIFLLSNAREAAPLAQVGGPILAVSLMGSGMIASAAAGRFWVGVACALASAMALLTLAWVLNIPANMHPPSTGLALFVASISFAARGALFARSAAAKGWWIAVIVVAGEAAVLLTAWVEPGMWPKWLLSLLPAQWANIAIQAALTGTEFNAASPALVALVATAAATLLVCWLWPRRWPYIIMFTTWLGMAALVYHQSTPVFAGSDHAIAPAPAQELAKYHHHQMTPDGNLVAEEGHIGGT